MKVSAVACALIVGGASAYQGSFTATRNVIRSTTQRNNLESNGPRKVGASLKMEDFGLFTNTGLGFDDIWEGNPAISEVGLENNLNKEGLRYRLNRTVKEAEEVGNLMDLPGFEVNLPLLGKTYLGPPKVASVWEALGFTATSNNAARQAEKMKAIEKARTAKKGVLGGPGAEIRKEWLDKYGYPRLVGSGGIFYADQLSTDEQPMGGFNMGKSGRMWPVPDVVEAGHYGGSKGWGMKLKGTAVDGLPAEK
mmetsp:Transcript_15850/g.23260  ORF Transcript_15850/g.23260 Transcript_15850/m.23260 type:complete len:251 (+) Transcript_15850:109-861(+)|eukprot:CAMPEP_0195509094 /NCGR_PEP_ID=MMETSP0794_2-20130614/2113_1 /TAXON_ID=515487 /ORGANISM="Stephanopyxis turris, Strain CCMP 815" /LENGTH=250 /DNA_ID=CAMNT_0040636221 /DNA_START=108 /DNA_END=860 /DNA_ORIENTATION=+